jgi:ubiquinone/menaquinone biosynthesis C-methylase UbiE
MPPKYSSMTEAIDKFGHKDGWNKMYEAEMTPWNLKEASLGLQDIKGQVPRSGKFIIPGCGEGYDVIFLAQESSERIVVGVDLSEIVVKSNRERVEKSTDLSRSVKDRITFVQADFFDDENQDLKEDDFDFLFDYTFLCAMHPSFRASWAKTLSRLLKKGAMLVTLMFPLDADKRDKNDGPPFPLSVELYHELLNDNFELVSINDCQRSPPKRQGREKIAIWRKK